MVCFETKEGANTAIQDLNETSICIAKEYQPIKQSQNNDNQNKIPTDRAKEKERKNNQLNKASPKLKRLNQEMDQNKGKSKEITI